MTDGPGWLAAVLAAAAVLAWPARRGVPGGRAAPPSRRSLSFATAGRATARVDAGRLVTGVARSRDGLGALYQRWRTQVGGDRDDGTGLLPVLDAVTAQLRGGAAPDLAWDAAVDLLDPARRLRRPPGWSVPDTLSGPLAAPYGAGAAAAAGAWRLAEEVGAPLAEVLERLAAGLREEVELATEVEASLAAPRATARLLAVLPVGGIALGEAIGAHPVGVLLTTGPGRLSGVAGIALAVAGHLWTRCLVAGAATASAGVGTPAAARP